MQKTIRNIAYRGTNFARLQKYCAKPQAKPAASETLSSSPLPEPDYNLEFLQNPANRDLIKTCCIKKKSKADIDKILELSGSPNSHQELMKEAKRVPNIIDPRTLKYGDDPVVLKVHGEKPELSHKPFAFDDFAKKFRFIKVDKMAPFIGQRGYFLLGDMADMEEALVNYSLKKLLDNGFKLISVPDLLPTQVIERCGMILDSERHFVYNLDPMHGDNISLSGTAEMALANLLANSTFDADELPVKLAAASRCFRAEVSSTSSERGMYRVHQFTKVEMFVCTEQEKSDEFLSELLKIQENLFAELELHFQVIDMPPHELGLPAYRKIDVEAWMPGHNRFGEVSSCSNCTDFQSRRLNIKYKTRDGRTLYVHTLNGTACAIPRMLIAISETQQYKGVVRVPQVLIPFMNGKAKMSKQNNIPATLKYSKSKEPID